MATAPTARDKIRAELDDIHPNRLLHFSTRDDLNNWHRRFHVCQWKVIYRPELHPKPELSFKITQSSTFVDEDLDRDLKALGLRHKTKPETLPYDLDSAYGSRRDKVQLPPDFSITLFQPLGRDNDPIVTPEESSKARHCRWVERDPDFDSDSEDEDSDSDSSNESLYLSERGVPNIVGYPTAWRGTVSTSTGESISMLVVLKIYDPIFQNIWWPAKGEGVRCPNSWECFVREYWAYANLDDLTGRLLPHSYGFYKIDLPYARGVPCHIMEYLDGESLQKRGRVEASQQAVAEALCANVVKSLAMIHQRNLSWKGAFLRHIIIPNALRTPFVFIDFDKARTVPELEINTDASRRIPREIDVDYVELMDTIRRAVGLNGLHQVLLEVSRVDRHLAEDIERSVFAPVDDVDED